MSDFTLYHAELSPCAHKVRIVLEERGIPFESRMVNLMAKENLKPNYLAINPKGVVPALVHGENIVTESSVICEYLDEVVEDHKLMPTGAMGKVRVRHMLKLVDEYVHPNTMPLLFGSIARHIWLTKSEEERSALLAKVPDPVRRARQERLIELGLDAPDLDPSLAVWHQSFATLEKQLSGAAWLAGDDYTLADSALTPYVFIMKYLKVDGIFDQFPKVSDWLDRIMARPSFDKAITPYVPETQWQMISGLADQSGPQLSKKLADLAA